MENTSNQFRKIPNVSVVMPVFNQEKYVAATIESVLNQTFEDFEFIILDDGSTDGSAEIIRKYAQKDRRIRAIFQDNNGKCISTNLLITMANAHLCALLDADDLMLPKRLERQYDFHIQNPEIDATSCHCHYTNETGRTLGQQRFVGLRSVEECRLVMINNQIVHCAFTGMMVSKKAFIDTGGLRSEFWPCEDYDFVNRFIEKGYVLVIIQEVLMKYRMHQSSITVRGPLRMLEISHWTIDCIQRRRSGKPELTLAEYQELNNKISKFKKIIKMKNNFANIYFRRAGMKLLAKNYLGFSGLLILATILSPNYVLKKFLNQIRAIK